MSVNDYINHQLRGGEHMKPLKSKVSITLDINVIEEIKRMSEADDRNFSQYINMVLKKHISNSRENGGHEEI